MTEAIPAYRVVCPSRPAPAKAVSLADITYAERTRVLGRITTVGHWTVVRCDDAALFQRHECRDEPGPVKEMWLEMQVVADGSQTRFDLAIGPRAPYTAASARHEAASPIGCTSRSRCAEDWSPEPNLGEITLAVFAAGWACAIAGGVLLWTSLRRRHRVIA